MLFVLFVLLHKHPNIKTSRVTMESPRKKSEAYLLEERRFSRDRNGKLALYDGRPFCSFYCTVRGCRSGDACRFAHVRLGCVYNQQAVQGCIYESDSKCPFSHDPDAVVIAAPLHACTAEGCDRSCMNRDSKCINCFNAVNRARAESGTQAPPPPETLSHHGPRRWRPPPWQSRDATPSAGQ